jgi:hypothetical protein
MTSPLYLLILAICRLMLVRILLTRDNGLEPANLSAAAGDCKLNGDGCGIVKFTLNNGWSYGELSLVSPCVTSDNLH